jgi:hypothetical protein
MAASLLVSAAELIERPTPMRPHVVLLGAGASCAAFPQGDAGGLRLPVMGNFVDRLDLAGTLQELAPETVGESNIEVVYPRLLERPEWAPAARAVEEKIRSYFSDMRLPAEATLYDRLMLSLRPTDTVFTFNWDPFLFDAMQRNRDVVPLPTVHFLHGCVRLATCSDHPDIVGALGEPCSRCETAMAPVPLLYPVEKKDYASHPSIAHAWNTARHSFAEALNLTVFGYGAPQSDVEAVDLLRTSWFGRSTRHVEHLELIDIEARDVLEERWHAFTPTLHQQPVLRFEESHIARWPRRVSESWFFPMTEAKICEDFPLPASNDLAELQAFCRDLASHERD